MVGWLSYLYDDDRTAVGGGEGVGHVRHAAGAVGIGQQVDRLRARSNRTPCTRARHTHKRGGTWSALRAFRQLPAKGRTRPLGQDTPRTGLRWGGTSRSGGDGVPWAGDAWAQRHRATVTKAAHIVPLEARKLNSGGSAFARHRSFFGSRSCCCVVGVVMLI